MPHHSVRHTHKHRASPQPPAPSWFCVSVPQACRAFIHTVAMRSETPDSQPLLGAGSVQSTPKMGRKKRMTSEPMLLDMETGRTSVVGGKAAAAKQEGEEEGGWRQYVTGKVRFCAYCAAWPPRACLPVGAPPNAGSHGVVLQYAALTLALVVLVAARTCDQTLYYRLNFSYSYFVWYVGGAGRAAPGSCALMCVSNLRYARRATGTLAPSFWRCPSRSSLYGTRCCSPTTLR